MLMTISPLQYPARLMEHGPKLPHLYKIDHVKCNYYNLEVILISAMIISMVVLIMTNK